MIQCWEMSFGVEEMGSSKWHAGQITYRMHNLHTYVLVRHTSSSTSLHTKKQTKQKKHEALCQISISHSKQWDLCHPPAALMPAPQTTTSADSPADDISLKSSRALSQAASFWQELMAALDVTTLLSRDLERSTSCSSTAEVQRARSQAWMAAPKLITLAERAC